MVWYGIVREFFCFPSFFSLPYGKISASCYGTIQLVPECDIFKFV